MSNYNKIKKKLIQWQYNTIKLIVLSDKNKIKNLSNDFTIKQNLYQTTTDKIKKTLITDYTIKQYIERLHLLGSHNDL